LLLLLFGLTGDPAKVVVMVDEVALTTSGTPTTLTVGEEEVVAALVWLDTVALILETASDSA